MNNEEVMFSYRDFTPQQVAMIIIESEKCTQQVHYECTGAALGQRDISYIFIDYIKFRFEKGKTQFTLGGSNRTVSRLGTTDKKCGQGMYL